MGDFYRCIDFILAEEGGYANHPADPGGETKYGISKRAYPHLNIAALTLEDATELYQRDYWQPIHGEAFPDGLALLLFAAAVNQGLNTAVPLTGVAAQVSSATGDLTLAVSLSGAALAQVVADGVLTTHIPMPYWITPWIFPRPSTTAIRWIP